MFNQNNTYRDVEQEIAKARKAFVLGIPSAISFGIVSVGDRYGGMFEMVDADTLSRCISRSPGQLEVYAKIMSDVAHTIHGIEASAEDGMPPVTGRLKDYISGGVALEDEALGAKCMELIDALPSCNTLVHGDFHTGNIFLQRGEPLLIDMDRVSVGHPIAEISDLYYFYVILGEDDPGVVVYPVFVVYRFTVTGHTLHINQNTSAYYTHLHSHNKYYHLENNCPGLYTQIYQLHQNYQLVLSL